MTLPSTGPLLAITRNDLRRRLRDRSLVVQTVVGPLLLAAIIGLALGDTSDFEPRIGVAAEPGDAAAAAVADGLVRAQGLDVQRFDSAAEVRRAVDDDEVGAGVVLPAGLDDATGPPATIAVVVDGGDAIEGRVAESIADGIADDLTLRRSVAGAATALGAPAAEVEEFVDSVQDRVAITETGASRIDPVSYFAPAMALLFLFFAVGAGARSFIAEENGGTLARLRVAPVRLGVVLGAKQLAVVVVGVTSVVAVWLASSVLIGADWGPPPAVLAVIVATVLAAAGIGTLITGTARTEGQANAYTLAVTFALALLGGNFVEPSAQPDALAAVARLTPNGQALRAFTDLAAGAGAEVVVVPVLVDLVVAGVTAAIGWRAYVARSGL